MLIMTALKVPGAFEQLRRSREVAVQTLAILSPKNPKTCVPCKASKIPDLTT